MQIGRYELKPEKQCLLGIFSTEYGLYWFYEEMTKYTYFTSQWLYVRKFSWWFFRFFRRFWSTKHREIFPHILYRR